MEAKKRRVQELREMMGLAKEPPSPALDGCSVAKAPKSPLSGDRGEDGATRVSHYLPILIHHIREIQEAGVQSGAIVLAVCVLPEGPV